MTEDAAFITEEAERDTPPRRPGRSNRPKGLVPKPRPTPAPLNFYPDLPTFVGLFLAPTFARAWHAQDRRRWCSKWWMHTEAVVRLEALWRAWEALRLDPGTGVSTWLRDHYDSAMTALTSEHGPFVKCSPDQHRDLPDLVTETPPPGMF